MRLAPITGLFGANSSGKTSILQLLLMLKQTVESSDRAQALIFGDERTLVNLGSFSNIVFGHKPDTAVAWEIAWKFHPSLQVKDPAHREAELFSGDQMRFEAEVLENGKSRLLVDHMAYELAGRRFAMRRKSRDTPAYELVSGASDLTFVRTRGRPWDLPPPVKCYGFPDQVKAYFQNAGFLADLQLAFEKAFGQVYYLGPLREYPQRQYTWAGAEPADMGQRGERVVDALLAARERKDRIALGRGHKQKTLEEYVAHWLKRLGLIHDFKVEAVAKDSNLYRVLVQRSPSSVPVPVTDVGFGVSQILPVLVLCYYVPKGSTILLEQPEIHLHPSVQAGLADVFLDAVRLRKVQIIFESHSEYLLQRLQRRIAEGKESVASDTTLYFCDQTGGESNLLPLEVDVFGHITNWPEGFFGDEFSEVVATHLAAMKKRRGADAQ
jgi:predicted ATPase